MLRVTVAPLTSTAQKLSVNRDKLQQVMHNELVKQKYNGYLVVNQEQEKLCQEATTMGLTVNQYLLWKRSQQQGEKIDIKEVKAQPVDSFIAKNDTGLNQMFPGMWCRVGGGEPLPVTLQPSTNKNTPNPNGQYSNCGSNANWPNYYDRWGNEPQ
jgi:hypothetical protein